MNLSHLRPPAGALPVLRAKIGLITPTSDFQDSRLHKLLLAAAKKNQKKKKILAKAGEKAKENLKDTKIFLMSGRHTTYL